MNARLQRALCKHEHDEYGVQYLICVLRDLGMRQHARHAGCTDTPCVAALPAAAGPWGFNHAHRSYASGCARSVTLAGSEVRALGSAALALVRTAFLEECATRSLCAAQLAATLGDEPPRRT